MNEAEKNCMNQEDFAEQLKTTREMWITLRRQNSQSVRNVLVEKYMPLVKLIAKQVIAKLPKSVQLGDLKSAGIFGLLTAIDGFDIDRGVRFETYCGQRIKGAIIDELRKLDWVPRLVRKRKNRFESSVKKLEGELGRKPTLSEVAGQMDITDRELEKIMRESNISGMVSLDSDIPDDEDNKAYRKLDFIEDKKTADPLEDLRKRELINLISDELSREERLIVLLYYYEQITMKEIGLALNVSESRVCQMHTQIIEKLKRRLAAKKEELLA